MSIIVFILLAALAAVAIAYPLVRPGVATQPPVQVSDSQVAGAVRRLREARKRGDLSLQPAGLACPACSEPCQPGDRFCVRCGQTLPQQDTEPAAAAAPVCPSCGAALREGDLFCARCGHRLSAPSVDDTLEEVQS